MCFYIFLGGGIDFKKKNSFYVHLLFYVSGLVNYYISSLGFPVVVQW